MINFNCIKCETEIGLTDGKDLYFMTLSGLLCRLELKQIPLRCPNEKCNHLIRFVSKGKMIDTKPQKV